MDNNIAQRFLIIALSLLAFSGCMLMGYMLSQNKPLLHDELYTQIYSIEHKTYGELIKGHVSEGNTSPLFYTVQKLFEKMVDFRFPLIWDKEWAIEHHHSQVIIRIVPNIFTSLMFVLLFYYFCIVYSPTWGIFALAVGLSYTQVWEYWVEARPYSLWMFLTCCQSLILLHAFKTNRLTEKAYGWLIITNILLSMTIIFGLAQIFIISFLIWLFFIKDAKKHIFMTFIPCCICIYYYSQTPNFKFWFSHHPLMLIKQSIHFEWLALYAGFISLWVLTKTKTLNTSVMKPILVEGKKYLWYLMLLFAAGFTLLLIFVLAASTPSDGFPLGVRYFLFLIPAGATASVIFSICLYNSFERNSRMRIATTATLAGFLIIRFIRIIDLPLLNRTLTQLF